MARPEQPRRLRRCGIMLSGALALAGWLATVLAAQTPGGNAPGQPDRLPEPASEATQAPAPAPAPPPGAAPAAPAPGVPHPGAHGQPARTPYPMPPELEGVDLNKQTDADVQAKSGACLRCHQGVRDPHFKDTVRLGCTDCHGANHEAIKDGCPAKPQGVRGCPAAPPAHNPGVWRGSGNPIRSYTLLNHESPDFIRFVNPGDLRVAHISCGTTNCHPRINLEVHKSMMTHGCMLWGAAVYNNGTSLNKPPRFGESYSMHGVPLRVQTNPPPSEFEAARGVLQYLDPAIRYENAEPANIFRIFERGGRFRSETGLPTVEEDPGRPIN